VGAEKEWGTRPLLVAGDTIYFSTEKSLSAVEPGTGRRLWKFSAKEIERDLQADDQRLYVVTHMGSMTRPKDTLHALALTTGQERWSRELNARVAMVHEGVIYADGERVHAIDAATGKELWSFKGAGRESARLVSGGRLFLTSPTVTYAGTTRVDQGYLHAIDAKTGERGSDASR
jgi:outer membrane protein assembly factor BamB